MKKIAKIWQLFVLGILVLISAGLFPLISLADSTGGVCKIPLVVAAAQQLSVAQAHKDLLANKLQALEQDKQSSLPTVIDHNLLERADLAVALAQADLQGITLTLTAAQQTVDLTQANIDALEDQAEDASLLSHTTNQQQVQLQQQIKAQQMLLNLQQARVKVLQQTQNLAQQTWLAAQDWKNQLQANYELQRQQQRQQLLDQLAATLQAQQQQWLQKLAQLNQQLTADGSAAVSAPNYAQIELAIFAAEEHSNLSQVELDLARLHNRLEDLMAPPAPALPLSVLNNIKHQIIILAQQLHDIGNMLKNKQVLLQQRMAIIQQGMQNGSVSSDIGQSNLNILNDLTAGYQRQQTMVNSLEKQIDNYQLNLTQQIQQQLASRQGLPGLDGQAWLLLGKKILEVPSIAWSTVKTLYQPALTRVTQAHLWEWLLWLGVIVGWRLLWLSVKRYLVRLIQHLQRRDKELFVNHALIICLQLVETHLLGFMLIGGFIVLLAVMSISIQSFSLFIDSAVVILVFNLLIGLTRLVLLETVSDESGSDVQLYYRLKWVLYMGGFLTVLTVLVHQVPVAYEVQDLCSRLFMLFLLVIALVLLRSWEVVPNLMQTYLEKRPAYLRQVVQWLSLLVPLAILSNSLVGLIGYVELAWSMGAYQGLFLMVLTGYLLMRGVLDELMKVAADQLIRWLRNGWLWAEALLKPLHQILKIILLLGAIAILFNLYGWGKHSLVVDKLSEVFTFQLFTLAGSPFTLLSLIEMLIIVSVLVWAGRWAREFAYRWLFANTRDVGLRNSLAMFTQYTTVTIGILIALRIMGINLTALTVIASAFAFGVGLGLRDLANNFMSGVLLLIERPVKVGDYVSVGDFEGTVMHIGMRSITVTTDDHKELLVPNADAFSKSFINWTHRDSIVRTLFVLKVSREDDPHRVKQIILEVLTTFTKILASPPPEVYFKKMDNVLLEFHIEYFVDLQMVSSRSGLHSKVLFALWDRFQQEGFHPPEYPHEIHVRGSLAHASTG